MRVTLGSLRADRAQHQREHPIAAGLLSGLGDTALVLSRWSFTGRGQPPATTPLMEVRRDTASADRAEAAKALAISRSKLYELLAAGLVRSVRIDGSRRVPVEALETYVASLLDQEETHRCQGFVTA